MKSNIVSAQNLRRRKPTDSQLLESFVDKQLVSQNVQVGFPAGMDDLSEEDVSYGFDTPRKDLRSIPCFTIDCADTKDMDDAVSLQPEEGGWCLGVHIADVAEFVPFMSELDEKVAKVRGTSIYLPNVTIPMLPPVLSDCLCSLVPRADRKAISALIHLDEDCNVRGIELTKSLIRSRLKGTYKQVNHLLSGSPSDKIKKKYEDVADTLAQMQLLAAKLRDKRLRLGAQVCNDYQHEYKLVDGKVVISAEKRGTAERIIEEFMVLANEEVAKYFTENDLPLVSRSHVKKDTLAFYETEKNGHAALAKKHYAHFTSPIRRLSDLKVHQVLTMHLKGASSEMLHMLFDSELDDCAVLATKLSRRAKGIQAAVENFCKRLYFYAHRRDQFSGTVCGVDRKGKTTVLLDGLRIVVAAQRSCFKPAGEKVNLKVYSDPEGGYMHAYGVCSAQRTY